MKKLFVGWISLMILLTSIAQADVGAGLQEAFQEYTYAMTVEWDQKDLTYKKKQEEILLERLQVLKAQGMKTEDVLLFLEQSPQGKALAEGLRLKLQHMDLGQMDREEILQVYNEILANSSVQGAQWLGRLDGFTIALIAIGALTLTVLGLWATGVVDCENERHCWGGGYDCDRKVVCK